MSQINDPNQGGSQMPPQTPPTDPTLKNGLSKDVRNLGMACHLLGLVGFIGPLIIWLIKKEEHPFIDSQGKSALNFQLTMLIGYIVGAATSWLFCVGALIWTATWVVSIIFSIIGAMKASDGIAYKYPFSLQLVK